MNMDSLFTLQNRVAVVTGSGSGLGKAIAEAYSMQGAMVCVVDIEEKNAIKTAADINQSGGEAFHYVCDVSDAKAVCETTERIISEHGKIDIMLNNAGIGMRAKAEAMTDEMWDKVLDINLKGAFLFCREAGRNMISRQKGGRIINMSSVGGIVGVETGNVNYCASKGGLISMTRCLAIEWAKHNILVNAIAPTHTRSPLIEKLIKKDPKVEQYFMGNIPLGRLATTADIIGPAVFLASDAASFITGHVLVVDGGHTAK